MYIPPDIASDLTQLRHRALIDEAERYRLARLARSHQRRQARIRRDAPDRSRRLLRRLWRSADASRAG